MLLQTNQTWLYRAAPCPKTSHSGLIPKTRYPVMRYPYVYAYRSSSNQRYNLEPKQPLLPYSAGAERLLQMVTGWTVKDR